MLYTFIAVPYITFICVKKFVSNFTVARAGIVFELYFIMYKNVCIGTGTVTVPSII
jgi:hypothetical protein